MHPILFRFNTPDFLNGIFPDTLTIYSYGFLIALGAILAQYYTAYHSKKQFNISFDQTQILFLLLVFAVVVGGKFFLIFEDPARYLSHPGDLLKNFGKGFVFYGSLIFALAALYYYIRYYKIPLLPMLDIIAGTTCIVHGMGRLGCFLSGCCYGTETDSFIGMSFKEGNGIDAHLHPTQLYSSLLIWSIFFYLLYIRKRQEFQGQLFLTYLILYSAGRSIIEIFRGDESRGYVIEGFLSNSQFISLIIFLGAIYFYKKFKNNDAYMIP